MSFCEHPNLGNDPRRDYCPTCKYEYYYGDAHATDPELQLSKLVNPGKDRKANGYPSLQEIREQELEEKYRREAWEDYHASQGGNYEEDW